MEKQSQVQTKEDCLTEINRLNQELRAKEKRVLNMEKSMTGILEKQKSLGASINSVKAQQKPLENGLKWKDEKIVDVTQDRDKICTENEQLKEEITGNGEKFESLQNEIKGLQNELADTSLNSEFWRQHLEVLEADNEQLESDIAHLLQFGRPTDTESLKKLEAEKIALAKTHEEKLSDLCTQMEACKLTFCKRGDDLNKEIIKLREKHESKTQDGVQQHFNQMTTAVIDLAEELERDKVAVEKKLMQRDGDLEQAKRSVEQLELKEAVVMQQQLEIDTKNEIIDQRLATLEIHTEAEVGHIADNTQLLQEYNHLVTENQSLAEQMAECRGEITKWTEQASSEKRHNLTLKKQIQENHNKMEAQRAEIARLENDYRQLQSRLGAAAGQMVVPPHVQYPQQMMLPNPHQYMHFPMPAPSPMLVPTNAGVPQVRLAADQAQARQMLSMQYRVPNYSVPPPTFPNHQRTNTRPQNQFGC